MTKTRLLGQQEKEAKDAERQQENLGLGGRRKAGLLKRGVDRYWRSYGEGTVRTGVAGVQLVGSCVRVRVRVTVTFTVMVMVSKFLNADPGIELVRVRVRISVRVTARRMSVGIGAAL